MFATNYATVSSPTAQYLNTTTYAQVMLSNGAGYAMPYLLDTNNSGAFNVGDTFCKPTSFQIISAGLDGSFGTMVAPSQTASGNQAFGRLYPTGFNYDTPPPSGGSADDDNVTNFCERSTLDAAKP